ncbi:hypothetical protein ACKKBF_B02810 [Auxenochlorella protothecoides x Auxenochlorella symbiontica]
MLRALASRGRQLKQLRSLAVRGYATEAGKTGKSSLPLILGLAGLGGGGYYAKQSGLLDGLLGSSAIPVTPSKDFKPDYQAVRAAIEDVLESNDEYDDGSYGPVLVRLAWHTSGTYDKNDNTGGSNGATMRFGPESGWGANAGLGDARDILEPIKKKFPWISYSDLWTLAGVVAIEAMGGPQIKWRPGRSDKEENGCVPLPDGRLPDASRDNKHVRDVFYRMGFNDQEIVALMGAHAIGRCHADRSGFVGPWTFSPTTFSNGYFTELKGKWHKKKWNGPIQYEDKTGELMMLPTDMWMVWDKKFRQYVDLYAKDQDKFFEDFAAAFSKLLELGVPFEKRDFNTSPSSPKPMA